MAYRTTRAESNKHFTDFRKDYPHISSIQIGARLGVSDNSISQWCSLKGRERLAPYWTVSAMKLWRDELEGSQKPPGTVSAPQPVMQPEPAPVDKDEAMFIVTVPTTKIKSFISIISMIGGEVTEL